MKKISNRVPNEQKYLKVAVAAAKKAGKIFKTNFGKAKHVSTKNGNARDLVTEIDRRIEQVIKKQIHKAFPNHAILGEEFGLIKAHNGSEYKWFIDPIDGTSNFIQGMPMCCISIGLWRNDKPLIGVIFNPILNTLYSALIKKGAFMNGKKIQVSKTNKLTNAFGGFGWGRNINLGKKYYPVLIKQASKLRTLGTTANDCCFLAEGIYDFHFQGEFKIWDIAAAIPIILEAGGKVTDWKGKPIRTESKNLIACAKPLHKPLLKIVK